MALGRRISVAERCTWSAIRCLALNDKGKVPMLQRRPLYLVIYFDQHPCCMYGYPWLCYSNF